MKQQNSIFALSLQTANKLNINRAINQIVEYKPHAMYMYLIFIEQLKMHPEFNMDYTFDTPIDCVPLTLQ